MTTLGLGEDPTLVLDASGSTTTGRSLVSVDYFPRRKIRLDVSCGDDPSVIIKRDVIERGRFALPSFVVDELQNVSQLGLKEGWLGKLVDDPGSEHNRWVHSRGVFNVGTIWLSVLEACKRVPKNCFPAPLDTWERLKPAVGLALLLHDYGHLPFAHLLNEALGDIHWLPASRHEGSEPAVLNRRFAGSRLNPTWEGLLNNLGLPPEFDWIEPDDIRDLVKSLILGDFGMPWVQSIVNSPIDADKIDYLRFDSIFLRASDYPIQTRLQEETPHQWLTEFLSDQKVNHAGLLLLDGKSARAAADLWRERFYLYDRFYLSPELRVPERIALEIVQQFLIQATMSDAFMDEHVTGIAPLSERLATRTSENVAIDPVIEKFEASLAILVKLLPLANTSLREFLILDHMVKAILDSPRVDPVYKELLRDGFTSLAQLVGNVDEDDDSTPLLKLRTFVDRSLVREPLILALDDFPSAREVVRGLQHFFQREAFIDIVHSPRVLAEPARYRTGFSQDSAPGVDYSILVPAGPISSWSLGQRATSPLTDECVAEIEQGGYCRIIVICPNKAETSRSAYIWDRVRASLIEAGLEITRGTR